MPLSSSCMLFFFLILKQLFFLTHILGCDAWTNRKVSCELLNATPSTVSACWALKSIFGKVYSSVDKIQQKYGRWDGRCIVKLVTALNFVMLKLTRCFWNVNENSKEMKFYGNSYLRTWRKKESFYCKFSHANLPSKIRELLLEDYVTHYHSSFYCFFFVTVSDNHKIFKNNLNCWKISALYCLHFASSIEWIMLNKVLSFVFVLKWK